MNVIGTIGSGSLKRKK